MDYTAQINVKSAEYRRLNIEECGYPYKFSVIMPLYKTEIYMREAVDSLITQTIGFEENVQLIFVNDGSPDNSELICDEYKQRYPNNIIVVKKENGGVSSARNAGIEYIEGRYVNFMDADDTFSINTFELVYIFFSSHDEYIDIASVPIFFFEGKVSPHHLNYKYNKGTRVVDLKKEYTYIQTTTNSSFIKIEKARELSFDTNLTSSEDLKEISKVLLEKQSLGVVSKCRYNRRWRSRTISALQGAPETKEFYCPVLKHFYVWVYNYYKKALGYIPFYIQHMVMDNLYAKIRYQQFPAGLLSEKEKHEFFSLLREVLLETDDMIILNTIRYMTIEQRIFLLSLKHDVPPAITKRHNNTLLSFGNTNVQYLENSHTEVSFLSFSNEVIKIEGVLTLVSSIYNIEPFISVNGEIIDTFSFDLYQDKFVLGHKTGRRIGFKCSIPIDKRIFYYSICVLCRFKDGTVIKMKNVKFGKFSPIGNDIKNSYYYKCGWMFTATNNSLLVKQCNCFGRFYAELKFLFSLYKLKRKLAKKAIVARCLRHAIKPFINTELWLISDRVNVAYDNGEAFFRFISNKKDKSVQHFFCISKDAADFERIKRFGKVIALGSKKHKLYSLLGATVISSHIDEIIRRPITWGLPYFRDFLSDFRFVFLRHGIGKDDLSKTLNRFRININMLVTATDAESNSFLEYNYHYTKKQIKKTGLPRYDLLYNKPQKYITIMPTWRKYLFGVNATSDLMHTNFFIFYDELLNHTKLLTEVKNNGYTLCVMLHPHIRIFMSIFNTSKAVIFFDQDKPYSEIFAESNMIITDYSSVAFDFAYLRKPLIYCQFDETEFFSGKHSYIKGYFDYRRDGFGEVEKTLDGTVNRIIEYMQNGCALKDKYLARIDATFAFNDKNNCERVYTALKNLERV